MKTALVVLLCFHGAIHFVGLAKGYRWGPLWAVAAALFMASAAVLAAGSRWWWLVAGTALVVSQVLIATAWKDAKIGTLANVAVLASVIVAALELRTASLTSIYRREVERGLARTASIDTAPVREADLERLPPALQTYLRRAGVVGKPRVVGFQAQFVAEMKPAVDADWMLAKAEQTTFFDEPTRLFLMRGSRAGVPFTGLHVYEGEHATMDIRLAGLVQIVDARGPEMDQSETVTMFNDMCVLAPASLLDAHVRWEEIDARHVRGTFTNAGHTISAELTFDEKGDLSGWLSNDRYMSADGKTYERYPWSTPVSDYRVLGGYRIATRGDAIWKRPQGDFTYGHFRIVDLRTFAQTRSRIVATPWPPPMQSVTSAVD